MIELMLFERDPVGARAAMVSGIRTFMVDWEANGKRARQGGFDTEIDPCTPADLAAIAAVDAATVWCRLNASGPATAHEIDVAIAAGAHGVFLPMIMTAGEVERFVELVDGRCGTGILVETTEAVARARDLASVPVDRVYFGLNDHAISRGDPSIFTAVRDGTVAAVRTAFPDAGFGFGGMTDISAGTPVPAILLLQEMSRLECSYTFLRRSFRRDSGRRPASAIVAGIHGAWEQCRARDPEQVNRDHSALTTMLRELGA